MPIGLCSIRLVHSTGEIESVFQVLRFDWLLAGLDVRAPIAVERLVPDVLLELRLKEKRNLKFAFTLRRFAIRMGKYY